MTLGYPSVTAVDVGVRETCPGNTGRKSTARGSHGVVGSPPPNAQGGALLPEVPTDPREKLDAATEAEETHGLVPYIDSFLNNLPWDRFSNRSALF